MSNDEKNNSIKISVIDHDVFQNFDLEFKQFNLLIGKNGSGKSTFLKLIHNLFAGGAVIQNGSLRVKCGGYDYAVNYPLDGKAATIPTQYIPESRYVSDNLIKTGAITLPFDTKRPYDRIAYSDDELAMYNQILSKIFGRTLRAKATASGTKMFYVKNEQLVEPIADGYGIVNINPIIQTLLNSKNNVILIEEIEENLHPAAIKGFLNFVFDIATKNNSTIFITTHSIMTVLEFTKRLLSNAKKYTITRFTETADKIQLTHLVENNINKSLEDFFGSFPDQEDVKILRKLSAFNRNI